MTPGSNLFLQAIKLIKPVKVEYLKFSGRTQNAARQFVPSFEPMEYIWVSLQSVSSSAYKALGLDLQRNYVKVFASVDVININRDSSGDRFVFNDKLYQIDNENNWFLVDGWVSCLAVEVGPANGVIT